MSSTTIVAIRATPVTVPLEAPILHSNGAHWGRFVRTIVEAFIGNRKDRAPVPRERRRAPEPGDDNPPV